MKKFKCAFFVSNVVFISYILIEKYQKKKIFQREKN